MPDGDAPELVTPAGPGPESFRLSSLQVGERDPRGRIVRDILWSVNEFKIYKTDQGISPFFCDDPKIGREQKLAYVGLGADIAEFNHLIHTMGPGSLPFTDKILPNPAARNNILVHYERELARCIAQALLGQTDIARVSLETLRHRLAARIANRGRIIHLLVNIILVAIAVAGSLTFARSGYVSTFGFNVPEIGLAIMMGSVGALFSTTARLQSMSVDPTVSLYMHWVYAAQRVLVGALGAMVLYFGFKSGVVSGLFDTGGTNMTNGDEFNPFWLSFVSVLAGFSERLVPNLLASKSQEHGGSGDAA